MPYRRRNWFPFLFAVMPIAMGCIRFRDDRPVGADAAPTVDADTTPDDATLPPEAGDAPLGPVCARFSFAIGDSIASDLITSLLGDCTLRRHFEKLTPVRVAHMQECLAAQIGSVMGCVRPDGERVKYPASDSNGEPCRTMLVSHEKISSSDGDFDAFVRNIGTALRANGLFEDEVMRVAGVFGATRNDIVRLKDAGPTLPCDAPDAQ